MLIIRCPHCGARDAHEFHYGGEAHIVRPEDPDSLDDGAWADYVFMRANPKGWHYERWRHDAGCGKWFNALRHTVTHAFHATYEVGVEKPEPPE
jgi:heterotetrameric sarcosine oxidase delta subunit